MNLRTRKIVALAELMIAAMLWGFGFIACIWGMKVFGPMELTFMRFAIAAVFGVAIVITARGREAWRMNLQVAFLPAVFLVGTLIFQTIGLQYTTATKSGFITTLYVVFVPLLESFIEKTRLPKMLWFFVATAMIGTMMIVNVGIDSLNIGDALTFIAALCATAQIYWLGRVSPGVKKPFVFNIVQSAWGALICAPVLAMTPLADKLAGYPDWPMEAWVGLISLSIGSTVVAFYFQVRAQAYLSATVSSLLFLLESPFALVFAMILLAEKLGTIEALGAMLIFVSAVGASWIEARIRKAAV